MQNENMTTEEAAEYLRVSNDWLRRLRSQGKGPRYAKLGNKVVYRKADLDAFVNANVVTPSVSKEDDTDDTLPALAGA